MPCQLFATSAWVNKVNLVNFVNMWKTEKFTTYPLGTKGRVNLVNFSQRFFVRGASRLPNFPAFPRLPGEDLAWSSD